MRKIWSWAGLLCLIGALTACYWFRSSVPKIEDVGVLYLGPETLTEVVYQWKGFRVRLGRHRGEATYSFPEPPPENPIHISWVDPSGGRHCQELRFRSPLPAAPDHYRRPVCLLLFEFEENMEVRAKINVWDGARHTATMNYEYEDVTESTRDVDCDALSLNPPVDPRVQRGIDALERGDYEAAYREFLPLAEAGNDDAMISIGLWYSEGTGFPQDYEKAMDWYVKAFLLGNGDAYNNIGVMYRDGLGVKPNRSIAYALFLLTHLRGLGTESTQYRANSNLRREVASTFDFERHQGLCMTEAYLEAFVESRGTLEKPGIGQWPSWIHPRIRDDKQLWLESEQDRMTFECPAPWD